MIQRICKHQVFLFLIVLVCFGIQRTFCCVCCLFSKQMKCRNSCRVVEISCSRWVYTCSRSLFLSASWNDQKLFTWSWIGVRGKYPRLLKPWIFASRHSTSSMRRIQQRPPCGCFCRNLFMRLARNGTQNRVL